MFNWAGLCLTNVFLNKPYGAQIVSDLHKQFTQRMKRILIMMGLLGVISSCTRVAVDKSANVNFNKYRTYTWMDSDVQAGKNPAYYNEIATQNVEKAVNDVLGSKGLQENKSNPDLLIGYHFFVEKETRTVANPNPYPLYGPFYGWGRWGYGGWGPGWWGYGGQSYRQEQYNAGTLIVDMVDSKTHKLVWRGSIENAVADPTRIGPQLTKEVEKILEKYPARNS